MTYETIHSAFSLRLGEDTYVEVQDITSPSIPDTVQVRFNDYGTDAGVIGSLEDLTRYFEQVTRDLSRIAASRLDAEARAREQADLRVLSGEHPVVPDQGN